MTSDKPLENAVYEAIALVEAEYDALERLDERQDGDVTEGERIEAEADIDRALDELNRAKANYASAFGTEWKD